jgi:hypothetical protein
VIERLDDDNQQKNENIEIKTPAKKGISRICAIM